MTELLITINARLVKVFELPDELFYLGKYTQIDSNLKIHLYYAKLWCDVIIDICMTDYEK